MPACTDEPADVALDLDDAPEDYSQMIKHADLRGRSRLRTNEGEEVWLDYVAGQVEVDGRNLYVPVGRAKFAG